VALTHTDVIGPEEPCWHGALICVIKITFGLARCSVSLWRKENQIKSRKQQGCHVSSQQM